MSKYVRRKDTDQYIYPYEKFFSNADPDLCKNNVGSTDRDKNNTDRRICIPLFTPLINKQRISSSFLCYFTSLVSLAIQHGEFCTM